MSYVDPDLYSSMPLNALARSSDIIEQQLATLGVNLDQAEPVSASNVDTLPTLSPETTTTPAESTTPAPTQGTDPPKVVMNGPAPTGETLGDVAESYGLPTSFKSVIDDAGDAFTGIMADLAKSKDVPMSYQDIFLKENRLRGLGSLCIVIGLVGVLLGGLTD